MGVGNINKPLASQQTQRGESDESDIKDTHSTRESHQHGTGTVPSQLQGLQRQKNAGPAAAPSGNTARTGSRFTVSRIEHDPVQRKEQKEQEKLSEQKKMDRLRTTNADLLKRIGTMPSVSPFLSSPGTTGTKLDYAAVGKGFQQKLDQYWDEKISTPTGPVSRKDDVAIALQNELVGLAQVGRQDDTLSEDDVKRVQQLRTAANPNGESRAFAISLANPTDFDANTELAGAFAIQGKEAPAGSVLLVLPGRPIEKFASVAEMNTALAARLNDPAQRDALLKHMSASERRQWRDGQPKQVTGNPVRYLEIKDDVFKDRVQSQLNAQKRDVATVAADPSLERLWIGEVEKRFNEAANGVRTRNDIEPYLAERGLPLAQEKRIETFNDSSADAKAVFDPPPLSPLEYAQQEFEKKFPDVPRPVDLTKIYVNVYQVVDDPSDSNHSTHKYVTSLSVADLVEAKFIRSDNLDLTKTHPELPNKLYYANAHYVSDPDTADHEHPQYMGISASDLVMFVQNLSTDINARGPDYFTTPGKDGKTPQQNLVEVRKEQIAVDAELQYGDKTLSNAGKALVDAVLKYPSAADRETAFPDASQRPLVHALSVKGSTPTDSARHDGNDENTQKYASFTQPLHGPLVMRMPRRTDAQPDDPDVIVLFEPGKGLMEFKSEQALKDYVSSSRTLLGCRSAEDAAWANASKAPIRYEFNAYEAVPDDQDVFSYSVGQQIDKEKRDTEYLKANPGKSRGVDLRASFDVDGPLTERDLRLIEQSRPEWWKKSSAADRALLGTYQDTVDELQNNLDALKSAIPTLEGHAATKIREELKAKYPDVDPDQTTVTITYFKPPAGPTRTDPKPQPEYETKTLTLTEYVIQGRQDALNPPDRDTGISRTLIEGLLPGTDVAELFRDKKVGVSATLRDSAGNVITNNAGRAATLGKDELAALATKLDIGHGYSQLLKDNYLGAGGRKLQATWKAAYLASMQAELQRTKMSGEIDALYDDKTSSSMVQAVLKAPDAQNREKVNGHVIQTEEFTVEIERKRPLASAGVAARYPVNDVLVIGAADKGLSTVVLYTPDAPDDKPFHAYKSREDMKNDPMFKQPEWIDYFKERVSHGPVPVSREKSMTEQDGVLLYGKPDAKSNYETKLNTKAITGDFTERLYQAGVSTKLQNADVASVTNDELHQESLQKKISAALGLGLDVADFVVDVIPFGKLAKALKALAQRVNPRKVLARLPKGVHLLPSTRAGNKAPFGIRRSDSSAVPLKGYEVNLSFSDRRALKYDPATGIHTDGGSGEYIKIGPDYYRSNRQTDAAGAPQRVIFRHNNRTDSFPVERVDGQWHVKQRDRLLGGGDQAASTTTVTTSPQSTAPTLRLRQPDRVRLDNLSQRLSSEPFDTQAYRSNYAELIDTLAADGNRDTLRRLVDLQTAEGNLSLRSRAEILAITDPYERARQYVTTFAGEGGYDALANFPGQLKRAIDNKADDMASAAATINNRLTEDRTKLSTLAQNLSSEQVKSAHLVNSELHTLLSSPANQDTLRRLVDIQIGRNPEWASDLYPLLSRPHLKSRTIEYLGYIATRKGDDLFAELSQDLKLAISRTTDPNASKRTLSQIAQDIDTRPFDEQAYRSNYAELIDVLAADGNQDTLRRLMDLQTTAGTLSLRSRADILAITDPYERARLYVGRFYYEGGDDAMANFPGQLKRAIDNKADDMASATTTIDTRLVEDRTKLSTLAQNLSSEQVKNAHMVNSELHTLLSSPANQDTLLRLIDVQTAEGTLSLTDRAQILANIRSQPNLELRTIEYLEHLNRVAGVGEDARAKLQSQLKRAIDNKADDMASVTTTINNRLTEDRNKLSTLAQDLTPEQIEGAYKLDSELQKLLSSPANQDTLRHLVDIQIGRNPEWAHDIYPILSGTNLELRTTLYLEYIVNRKGYDLFSELPQDLKLAIARANLAT
ncbi:hypothetical protein WK68_13005 [Burkholderia ubonensis]|uniref:dermonecrotic toxin domain-containing protein n=1 Tax=Burkholderia ubonensis TaxID=101571 RepID=UPI000756E076|nr:DUF6543 domain-containing protein [Burkholderia ubonensis]KVU40933.1 hypothetical protein WK68_13005 [Burkholderia ubonensis]